MSTTIISLLLTLALVGPPPPPPPRPEAVADAVARAETAYVNKDYEGASKAFAEAFALDPNPVYLYARAQAERLAGRCGVALPLYDRYLQSGPPTEAAQEAKINRARCEAAVDGPPVPPAAGTEAVSDDAEEEDSPSDRPWYRDPAGGALVGVGAVTAATGAGILGIALANDADASGSGTEEQFIEAKDDARVRYAVGIALVSVGVVLLVGGVVRWGVVARRRSERQARLGPGGLTVEF